MASALPDDYKRSNAFGTSRAHVILGIVLAFAISSTISIALRFVGKRRNKTKFSSEDWVVIAAQVVVYGLGVSILLDVALGNAGHHAWESPSKVPEALKTLIAVQCLYAASISLIKVSICLFYNRIFPFRRFRIASWVAIGLVVCWAAGSILYTLLSCRPLSDAWKPTDSDGTCARNKIAHIIIGILNIITNIYVLVLPLPLLYRLRLSTTDKISLIGIFGAGICTIAISILRLHAHTTISFENPTYTSIHTLIYTFLEPAIAISVACAPLSRPVFRRNAPKLDIELNLQSHESHRRLGSWLEDLPSYVDRNLWSGRRNGFGREETFVTTQVLESGTWSQASESRTRLPSGM